MYKQGTESTPGVEQIIGLGGNKRFKASAFNNILYIWAYLISLITDIY